MKLKDWLKTTLLRAGIEATHEDLEAEFEIVSEEVYDWDYSDVEEFEVV